MQRADQSFKPRRLLRGQAGISPGTGHRQIAPASHPVQFGFGKMRRQVIEQFGLKRAAGVLNQPAMDVTRRGLGESRDGLLAQPEFIDRIAQQGQHARVG